MRTQALEQKLLGKGVILAMGRECKSLASWVYQGSQNLYPVFELPGVNCICLNFLFSDFVVSCYLVLLSSIAIWIFFWMKLLQTPLKVPYFKNIAPSIRKSLRGALVGTFKNICKESVHCWYIKDAFVEFCQQIFEGKVHLLSRDVKASCNTGLHLVYRSAC